MHGTNARAAGRRLIAVTGVVVIGAVIAGCSTPAAPSEPDAEASSTLEPAVTVGKTVDGPTLTIWADSFVVPALADASAAFTDKYQVNVEIQPMGFGDVLTGLQQAGPAGEGPDLIDGALDWTGPLVQAGVVEPLDLGSKLANFDERAIEGFTYDGTLYGMPITVESYGMFRNPDLVPEPVTSWDQMSEVLASLTAAGVEYPLLLEPGAYLYQGMLSSFGGYVYGRNVDGSYDINDVGLDNEGAIASAAWLDNAYKSGWMKPGIDQDVINEVFPAGQAGLLYNGPWMAGSLEEAGANFVIDPLPAGPAGPAHPWVGSRGLFVNKFSEQVTLAQTFLTEYWATDEPMLSFASASQKESAWLPVKDESTSEVVAAFAIAGAEGYPTPNNPELQSYWGPMTDALNLIGNQQATPEEAMKAVAEKVRAGSGK